MIYYNIIITILVVLFDIACITLSYRALSNNTLPEWEQEAFAFTFIMCGVGMTYAIYGVTQS